MRDSTSELSSVLAAPAPRASNGTAAPAAKNRLREVMSNLLLELWRSIRLWSGGLKLGRRAEARRQPKRAGPTSNEIQQADYLWGQPFWAAAGLWPRMASCTGPALTGLVRYSVAPVGTRPLPPGQTLFPTAREAGKCKLFPDGPYWQTLLSALR